MQDIKVLYGSQTGTAQDFAYRVSRILSCKTGYLIPVLPMNSYPLEQLQNSQVLVFMCSTTGQGQEPDNMVQFWRHLLKKKHGAEYLQRVQFAVFGLGDSSYEQFNFTAKKLDRRLSQLGASRLLERGEGDEQHDLGYFAVSELWLQQLISKLGLDDSMVSLDLSETLFAPKFDIQMINSGESLDSRWEGPQVNVTKLKSFGDTYDQLNVNEMDRHSIDATVLDSSRLTAIDHFQDIRQIDMQCKMVDNESCSYSAGDVLAVWPKNNSYKVQQLLDLLGWNQIADENIRVCQNGRVIMQCTSLRELLTAYLEPFSTPKSHSSLFYYLSHFTSNAEKKAKLQEFAFIQKQSSSWNPSEILQDIYAYLYRPRRTIEEIIVDFEVQIPPSFVFEIFPQMVKREFSICSYPQSSSDHNYVSICVGVIDYKTVLKSRRLGIGSNYLAQLQRGDNMQVELKKGSLRIDWSDSSPLILIGPGLGIAPLRSIWQQNIALGNKRDIYLFTGCRVKGSDDIYQDELQKLQDQGAIRFMRAYSRQIQGAKFYVQDLMRQQSQLIQKLVVEDGASVILCGNAKRMPSDVENALSDILRDVVQEPIQYLRQMKSNKRFQIETWQ
ncbi:hypothetical protein MP228_002031 [Amoeboaphelidium protococcarum]|nr:hypothetical protein MP228_002031 [Amoeboaphelidium protococcarum]